MKSANKKQILLALCLSVATLLGCGASVQPVPIAPPSETAQTGSHQQLPADFARRECAIYKKMEARQRACTIKINAEAGRRWLEIVSGKSLGELSQADQLSLTQQTLRSTRKLTATELADVGWFVAEILGGRYRWDASSAQIVLESGSLSEPIVPMTLVQQIRSGERDLIRLPFIEAPGRRPPADSADCKDIERVDVLQHRLTWNENTQ